MQRPATQNAAPADGASAQRPVLRRGVEMKFFSHVIDGQFDQPLPILKDRQWRFQRTLGGLPAQFEQIEAAANDKHDIETGPLFKYLLN